MKLATLGREPVGGGVRFDGQGGVCIGAEPTIRPRGQHALLAGEERQDARVELIIT